MKITILVFAIAVFIAPQDVSANDGFAAVGVGGLSISKTDNVAIKREVLDVSCDNITANYDFINESEKDEDALLMFPLPEYAANIPSSDTFAVGQPADFKLYVDGQPVEFQTRVKALLRDYDWVNNVQTMTRETDVTDTLKKAGLTEKDIVNFRFATKYIAQDTEEGGYYKFPISDDAIKILVNAGLMAQGRDSTPQWDNQVTYIWKQRFPGRKVIHVQHSYRPFTSGGANAGFSPHSDMSEFCLTKESSDKLESLYRSEKNRDNYNNIPGINVKYILTTANSWKDGIRDFTLRIHSKSKGEVVSACIPAAIDRISDTVHEAKLANFKPKQELSVYFGNARHCDGGNAGVPPKVE